MKKLYDTYRADSEVTDGCIALPLPFAADAIPLPLPFALAAEISSAVALMRGTAFVGLGMSKFALQIVNKRVDQ